MQTLDVPMQESGLRKLPFTWRVCAAPLYLFALSRIVCAGRADCFRGALTAAFQIPGLCSCGNAYYQTDALYAFDDKGRIFDRKSSVLHRRLSARNGNEVRPLVWLGLVLSSCRVDP